MWAQSLVSGAGQPTRHFNSEDGCPISEGTIRKRLKRSFTTGIRCFSYFFSGLTESSPEFFVGFSSSLNTHPSLAETTADKASACSDGDCMRGRMTPHACLLVKQLSVIILEVFSKPDCKFCLVFFFVSPLISTAVKELLRAAEKCFDFSWMLFTGCLFSVHLMHSASG